MPLWATSQGHCDSSSEHVAEPCAGRHFTLLLARVPAAQPLSPARGLHHHVSGAEDSPSPAHSSLCPMGEAGQSLSCVWQGSLRPARVTGAHRALYRFPEPRGVLWLAHRLSTQIGRLGRDVPGAACTVGSYTVLCGHPACVVSTVPLSLQAAPHSSPPRIHHSSAAWGG